MSAPVQFQWTGEEMKPLSRFAKRCDEEFVIGQVYHLVAHEEPSQATRGHYFACVKEAWKNLSEEEAERFPSTEHLRKWALVKAGYRNENPIVCASHAEAIRAAATVRTLDEYAVVVVADAVVRVYRAQSQSARAMGKKPFAESKTAVLDILAGMIGVTTDELAKNTGQAA